MSVLKNKEIPVPVEEEGSQKEFESHEETDTIDEAKKLFAEAKERLLNVNKWDQICGKASAVFKLTDENGNEVDGKPKVSYHFKIDIPAPDLKTGEGYDWVRVEAIEEKENAEEDSEFIIMRVRPSSNPTKASGEVAHFFSDKSTSNFLIQREKKTVTAAVLGRNEVANTDAAHSLLDKLRNAIVGTGALGGLSYPQWKSLVKGLLGK